MTQYFTKKRSLMSAMATFFVTLLFVFLSVLVIRAGWWIGWAGFILGIMAIIWFSFYTCTKIEISKEEKHMKWVLWGITVRKIDLGRFSITELLPSDHDDGNWTECIVLKDGKNVIYLTNQEWDQSLLHYLRK